MSTQTIDLKLTYNPEDIPTSFTLHVTHPIAEPNCFQIVSVGVANTQPNANNKVQIEVIVEECDCTATFSPFVIPLTNLDIEDPLQEISVTASADSGTIGQGTIKSIEAQNESRPIGA